jgi:hypothetical protein
MINEYDEKKFLKRVYKPSFKYWWHTCGCTYGKARVTLNKPIIVGNAVLSLSKLKMYQFWYGYVKKKYGDKVKLGYMDTSSIMLKQKTYIRTWQKGPIFSTSMEMQLLESSRMRLPVTSLLSLSISGQNLTTMSWLTTPPSPSTRGSARDMATNTYFLTLNGSLLDKSVNETEIFDPIAQVYRDYTCHL